MTSSSRMLAYQTLTRVYKDNAYTNVALQHALSRSQLTPRDKSLTTEIVYGTVRRQISIDAVLQLYVKKALRELDPSVLTILRMSVYQLAFLSRVPAYAVIDEAVELTKRFASRASGFVNGVLRSYRRDAAPFEDKVEQRLLQMKNPSLAQQLGVRHGYPTWMVASLLPFYGEARTEQILMASNEAAPVTFRVNRLKTTPDEAVRALELSGLTGVTRGRWSDDAIVVNSAVDVESLPLYREGHLTLQDEGAMLIAPLLGATPGMEILDMCAAPGGKTTHIAELQLDQGHIDAYDVYLQKVKMIRELCARLGISSVTTRLGDGREARLRDTLYDAVLVDAPCSGLGVLRRRPDIRHRRKQEDIATLAQLQRELLASACASVRRGGIVVYATCTLLPEENDQVVEQVVAEWDGQIAWEPIRDGIPDALALPDTKGLTLTPDMANTDGFYMAKLRRL